MAQLTKEYFDKKLESLATKDDLDKLEIRLKKHTEDEVAALARITKRYFDEIDRKLDVKEKVEKLQTQMREVRQAIGLMR